MSVEVVGGICESWHRREIRDLLDEIHTRQRIIIQLDTRPTFRDSEETKEHNAIAMRSSNVIVYITDGEIKGPVFIVSCSYRYSSFVATKDYWAKDRAMRFGILRN